MIRRTALVAMLAIAAAGTAALAAFAQPEADVVSRFSTSPAGTPPPAGWTPLTFPRVKHTRYELVREGDRSVLRGDADGSASGLVFRIGAPATESRVLRWRWKGERMPSGADTTRRSSEDAVARVYVSFRRPPEGATAAQRFIDEALRRIFGEAPPHATLLYVWDNRVVLGSTFANPYTDRVRNIVVESGTARLSQWLSYERDLVADYRAAFGSDPPPIAGVAIMTDADNTDSSALAWYGDITLSSR